MEQKVDKICLSRESRLWIYKQVLKKLREAYKYNESVKHDTKYRFNRLMDTLKKAEIACSRLSRDVGALGDNQVDQFFIDSDQLRELILLISDRIMGNENNYDTIKGCLNLLPSNELFDNQN